ncbi:MAG: nuclear transport factor 2 family protein [Acidobacteria bacterium]|nr:nuclear transport factor 2 family protein [Acidobacteriota bacterium]
MLDTLKSWHEFIERPDSSILDAILAEDVRFHSPFVWKPKDGKLVTSHILMTVSGVFEDFTYVREIIDADNWCLEFSATVGGLSLRGVDLIRLGPDGKIVDFEVMIRPANALQVLGLEMGRRLGGG